MIQSIPSAASSAPGGGVGGASNLTTAGAVPFVQSAGVLTQDAGLNYDSVNDSLSIGLTTAKVFLGSVTSGGVFPGVWLGNITPSIANYSVLLDSGFGLLLNAQATSQYVAFRAGNTERARFAATTGNLLIGTTTDSNYKLDIAASGSSGTVRVFDQTATVGVTQALLVNGAGQSTTPLLQFSTAAYGFRWDASSGVVFTHATNDLMSWQTSMVGLASASVLAWSGTSNSPQAVKTAGIAQAASGVLEINNGTAGTLRDLLLRYLQNTGVTVATLPAAAAGNAGSRAYVTDANATTIGTTVAGGGANKVMVWSDGTNWKIYAS